MPNLRKRSIQDPVNSTINHCLYKHGNVSVFSRTSYIHTQSSSEAQLNNSPKKKEERWGGKGRERKERGEKEFVSDDGHARLQLHRSNSSQLEMCCRNLM